MLLLLDTANEKASVCLAEAGKIVAEANDHTKMNHAAFIQPAIKKLVQDQSLDLKRLEAIAVMAGPGSYTGLRVGMASAKGLCYALDIPLISVSTLQAMALAVINFREVNRLSEETNFLICPMIDARRMEVFTAVYDAELNEILSPRAMILDHTSFNELLASHKIIFTGNGAEKFTTMLQHQNLHKTVLADLNPAFAVIADRKLRLNEFTSVAYGEPEYLKGIHVQSKQPDKS